MKESQLLLDSIYETLDYKSGDLVDVESYTDTISTEGYIAKGQWLDTCHAINKRANFKVDKLFFVQNNPVVVFVDATDVDKDRIFSVYNEIWSLARPRLVFIENNTSITIYDLAANPAKSNEDLNPLSSVVTESKEILEQLKTYNRAGIESGAVFGDKRFSTINRRADLSLINDLKHVRKKLFDNGLNGDKLRYAHALIGRSIFIRYLEDRGVLTKDYFLKVAHDNKRWQNLINTPLQDNFYREEMRDLIYPRLLADKELTYRLFEQIAKDFNGDTFSSDVSEERIIEQTHLDLLQNFLLGQGNSHQQQLFLWAYRFDVIPIDLISSIYEEFYHSENLINSETKELKDGKGTHYTPSSLVEFVLSRTLTLETLKTKPRVLDPACGSGIFLVESFRRMVRYELSLQKRRELDLKDLLSILKNQIAGIEINPEAIKIAAFSLYLSLLHYLNPPSILEYVKSGGKLPYLIWHDKREKDHFNILLEANSFNNESTEEVFEKGSFDAVVGNPPWGSPGVTDTQGRNELEVISDWCKKNNVEFPKKEPSSVFLFRALDFLRPNGSCVLLVSSGVLFRHSRNSIIFRRRLISENTLEEVVNFSHVRHVFFSAVSPFILLKLKKTTPKDGVINYISIRKTNWIDNTKNVIIESRDFKSIKYSQTIVDDVWKIFYWGSEHDFNFINSIRRLNPLSKHVQISGRGYQESNKAKPAEWLKKYRQIPTEYFKDKYGSIDFSNPLVLKNFNNVPDYVEARGKEDLYHGIRILIRRGIVQDIEPKGQIISRLEHEKFAFKNSIHGIKLNKGHKNLYKIMIGILWSSVYRYYMFMTASTWGTWMQEIHMEEILNFPIPKLSESQMANLSQLVDEILSTQEKIDATISNLDSKSHLKELEIRLDDLVYDAYELTDFERNLVKDRCLFEIDYFYHKEKGLANQPTDIEFMDRYTDSFKKYWSKSLEVDEYFESQIMYSKDQSMLGVLFHLRSKQNHEAVENRAKPTLEGFEALLKTEISRNFYADGLLRRVSEDTIFIVKRNLKGHWTQSEAFADAEATLLQAMIGN